MPDQEVHEIQLNGKQLVFMFGAATMVSVVIFLCGVMVGRGVRQPQSNVLAASTDSAIDPTASFETTTSRSAFPAEPAPAPAQETLTYPEHLEAPVVPGEPLKPAEEPKPAVAPALDNRKAAPKVVPARETKQPAATKAPAAVKASAQKPDATKADSATADSRFVEPPGKGFVLQVGVFPTEEAAEAQRRRLAATGYNAFFALNPDITKGKYRVRVGRYATKGEADAAAARLRQEERVNTWRIP
jgi:DedD protein